jgi:hypothetical protein
VQVQAFGGHIGAQQHTQRVVMAAEAVHQFLLLGVAHLAVQHLQLLGLEVQISRQALAQLSLNEQTIAARTAQDDQRAAIEASTASAEKWLGWLEQGTNALLVINPLLGAWTKLVAAGADEAFGLSDGIEEGAKQTKVLDAQLALQAAGIARVTEETEKQARAKDADAAAEKARQNAASGGRSGADPAAAAEAEADAKTRAAEEEARVVAQLTAQIQSAQIARLEGSEKIDAEARREIARLDEIAAKYQENTAVLTATQAAQLEIITAANIEKAALDA